VLGAGGPTVVPGPGVVVVVVGAATHRRRQGVFTHGPGVVDVVEVVVLVVVEVVEVVVVEVVVDVFAHPPTGSFQIKPPLPFDPATYRHSPWQTGFTTTGAGVVDGEVVVDSSITSGRSFDHVSSLCR
jgi:hypothetical protein